MKPSRRARLSPLPWYEQLFTGCWTLFLGLSLVGLLLTSLQEPIRPNGLGWRTCTGQIVTAEVRTANFRGETWFQPRVEYRYDAGDRSRTSTTIRRDTPRFRTEAEALEFLADYRPGDEVTVYHRNRMENRPVLDRGYQWRWTLFFSAIACTVLAALGLRYQMYRNTVAYRGGAPEKVVTKRTPRPIRSAFEGEVRPGEGYGGTLRKMIQPTQGYRVFRKLRP